MLFVEGTTRFDVKQGCVGDCYFVAVLAALGDREELIKQVSAAQLNVFHADSAQSCCDRAAKPAASKPELIDLQWSGRTEQVQNLPKLRFLSICFVWHWLINVKSIF